MELNTANLLADDVLRLVLENMRGALWEWNISAQQLLLSARWHAMLGYERDEVEVTEETVLRFVHPDDIPGVRESFAALRTGRQGKLDIELRQRHRDGYWVWVHCRALVVSHDEHGKPARVIGVNTDISRQKSVEQALRASEARFRAAIDGSLDAFFLLECVRDEAGAIEDFVIVDVNGQAEAHMGKARPELLGRAICALSPRVRDGGFFERYRRCVEEQAAFERDYFLDGPASMFGWNHHQVVPLENGVAIFVRNIHEQRRQQQELEQAKEQAEQGLAAKNDFLKNMSHELRTPLQGILGTATLLLGSALSDEQREQIEIMRASSDALRRIVEDLLDATRLEGARGAVERRPFSLAAVLQRAAKLMTPEATDKGLELAVRVSERLPSRVEGDAERLFQVVVNLVGNAIKFTERGGVEVGATEAGSDGQTRVRIEVRDSGIGIARERQTTLFQKFSQIDTSTSRRHGGLGLGLAICKQIVDRMGGTIGVESQPGVGSTFCIELPLRRAAAEPAAKTALAPAPLPAEVRMLLVEDNPTNQRVVKKMLEKLGATVELASDGAEAVAKATRGSYDLILMDCQMPVVDGYEATRQIRALGGATSCTPIVALTAHALSADRERCLAAGMDDYLTKPITPDALRPLWGLLGRSAQPPPAPAQDALTAAR